MPSAWAFGICALACRIVAAAATTNPFQVVTDQTGGFVLTAAAWNEFSLTSEVPEIMIQGQLQQLAVNEPPQTSSGQDALGGFESTLAAWQRAGDANTVMTTQIRVYDDVPAVVFESYFPVSVLTEGTYEQRTSLSSTFPAFAFPASVQPVGLMRFDGPFLNANCAGPTIQRWGDGSNLLTDGDGGGPVVFFDGAGNSSVVVGPASNFMIAALAQSTDTKALRSGLVGSLSEIPAHTAVSFMLWYGAGANAALTGYGAALLQLYGKPLETPQQDYTNTHLTYNTDNGAFFYYNTGNYSNYLEALMAVHGDAQARGIPYKAVLLDSWWYPKGTGDGVLNWTAMPTIFPGGNAGIRNLTAATGWKVIAHNRYWANDTTYATQNGGPWQFYVDSANSPAGGETALPLQQDFWTNLLADSAKEWGLTTYEQDWLFNEWEQVDILTSDARAARTWLLQMNAGAQAAGVWIQYCMPYPRHALQSVELSQVTQIRASGDHFPPQYASQWQIGYSSMLAAALGLAPFKDNFYSAAGLQPGGKFNTSAEVAPSLQNAISVLSAGPVTPGDGPGFANAAEILRSCTAEGALLHPSRPATAINAMLAQVAFPSTGPSSLGQIYATYSGVSGWVWGHILAAALPQDYSFSTSDLTGTVAAHAALTGRLPYEPNSGVRALRSEAGVFAAARAAVSPVVSPTSLLAGGDDLGVVAYAVNSTSMTLAAVQAFDAAHPIHLLACGVDDFQMWHTAPVHASGWAFLGELTKYVPVSAVRVASVSVMGTDLLVRVTGKAGEAVPLTFWEQASEDVATLNCVLNAAGEATAVMPYGTCA